MANCDSCVYNVYDDDDECYYCEVDMDEDDAARLMQVMLLSFVNTQLRDFFTTLDLFCENFNVNRSELEAKLKSIDYEYDAATNQFV